MRLFPKNRFPTIFGGHLEFLRNMQKCIYLRNSVRQSDFDEIFYPQGICIVYGCVFSKIVFLPFLVAILNFCINAKNHIHLLNLVFRINGKIY